MERETRDHTDEFSIARRTRSHSFNKDWSTIHIYYIDETHAYSCLRKYTLRRLVKGRNCQQASIRGWLPYLHGYAPNNIDWRLDGIR